MANQDPKQAGVLATTLEPLVGSHADLQVVMKYSLPHRSNRATLEILPDTGRRVAMVARAAGFILSPTAVLQVEGANHPVLAHIIANTMAWTDIKLRSLSAQVVNSRYSALFGFRTDDERRKAASLIRKIDNDKTH